MIKKQIISPIKYVGGKQRHFKHFLKYIPGDVETLIDAFGGGGGFYLQFIDNLTPKKAIYNDYNNNLVNMYREIKEKADSVNYGFNFFDIIVSNGIDECKKYWYILKKEVEKGTVLKACELIWFNTFSMNGYISPKSKWSFNHLQTWNKDYRITKINYVSELLNKPGLDSILLNKDYKELEEYDKEPNAFWYFDPPYNLKFSAQYYSIDTFNLKEFISFVKNLKSKWMISFNDDKLMREEFKDYFIYEVKLSYSNIHRSKDVVRTNELLITNYEVKNG